MQADRRCVRADAENGTFGDITNRLPSLLPKSSFTMSVALGRPAVASFDTKSETHHREVATMKRAIIGCIVAFGLVLGGAGAAFAGETNGQGMPIPGAQNASSACAFSGQDLPDLIEGNPTGFDDDFVTGGRVQSYGKYVSHGLKGVVPSPGVACRGNVDFEG